MKKCSSESCIRPVHNGDLCNPHFRMRREGLPEAESVWVARRLASVEQSGDCIFWTGRLNNMGYGICSAGRGGKASGGMAVHRWFYERFRGPIPDGLVLDHLCRNPRCVNVDHLEPVTQQENDRRGQLARGYGPARTHCGRGHELVGDNVSVRPGVLFDSVRCRTCWRENKRRQTGGGPRITKTHCPAGHAYDETNTHIDKLGHRHCRACSRATYHRRRQLHKEAI